MFALILCMLDSFRMFLNTFSSIIGAILLIAIILPWFLIAVAVCGVMYIMAAAFYRASAREIKVCHSLQHCARDHPH